MPNWNQLLDDIRISARVGNSMIAICTSLLLCSCATVPDKTSPPKNLLNQYRGEVQLPDDLYDAYAAFVRAIDTADQGTFRRHCLPYSVTFTTEPRPENTYEYGQDLNIPFIKNGFFKDIMYVRQDSNDTYLIRTTSSYMWFVKTKSEGWKLYRYGDKPIE